MGCLIALGNSRTFVSVSINDLGFFDMLMQCFYLKDP
jgi:hypothetical protein